MQNPETRSGQGIEADEITLRLTESFAADNVIVLKFGPNLLDELEGLTNSRSGFDVVIVDTIDAGFLFPSEKMIAASTFAREFLEVQGALVFVTKDRAAAFIKESPAGFLSFHLFDSFSMVYDYSASIAKYIQQAMGQSIQIQRESTDLAEQILLTIIPVLTNLGIKMKASVEGSMRRNIVLTTIDNYTPLNAISQRLSAHMKFEEALEEFKLLEKAGAIYPIFPKIPFLVQHFRNGRQFKLKDYLLEAQLLSREQLDNAYDSIQNAKGAQRLSLGAMCVAKGYISARQLEIALQDQAFFGQMRGTEKVKMRIETEDDNQVHSLIGSLKTTDSAGVLQNLASNRANGVLVVEFKDLTFRAVFEQGKLSFAKQIKLAGNAAVTEFVSVWKEGVYVFIERTPPPDLVTDECKITRPLDKLLLDSALASDNIEVVWKKLAAGDASILEKLPDRSGLLVCEVLKDPQEGYELNIKEVEHMQLIWNAADGISAAKDILKRIGTLTTVQGAMAISRLLHYGLIRVPGVDLDTPLANFRTIIGLISEKIGVDHSEALLRISLRESQGYSATARIFSTAGGNSIGVDLAAAKSAFLSLSNVVKALEDWQVKYIEHVSHELDKNILRELVLRVYKSK